MTHLENALRKQVEAMRTQAYNARVEAMPQTDKVEFAHQVGIAVGCDRCATELEKFTDELFDVER